MIFQYTVPAEAGLCALYAESFDGAYSAVRQIHGCAPSYVRVVDGQNENDWLCPLGSVLSDSEAGQEIRRYGYIRWDGNSTEAWKPRVNTDCPCDDCSAFRAVRAIGGTR